MSAASAKQEPRTPTRGAPSSFRRLVSAHLTISATVVPGGFSMFKTSAGVATLCAILLAGCNSKQAVTPAALEAAQPAARQAPAIVLPQGTLLDGRRAQTLDTSR